MQRYKRYKCNTNCKLEGESETYLWEGLLGEGSMKLSGTIPAIIYTVILFY